MTSDDDPVSAPTLPASRRTLVIEGTTLCIGDILDAKYRVDHVLGVGGMGVVLAATNLETRQRVAIKLLLPASLEDPTVLARFEREARAAAMLQSEHVARVIDVAKLASGEPYLVMELLDGVDLEEHAEKQGPLPPEVAVDYVLQACMAIAEAHGRGIIHRDLKPQNLFLTKRSDGSPLVKVLDFGLSKIMTEKEDLSLTRSGDVMGSPLYMSPEQLRDVRKVDTRSDIWAIGSILFRLISGRTPFDGETMAQVCNRILGDPVKNIRRMRPETPDGLAIVIERCLEKAPTARFPNVETLADALRPFSRNLVPPAAPTTHRTARTSQRTGIDDTAPDLPEFPEDQTAPLSLPPSALKPSVPPPPQPRPHPFPEPTRAPPAPSPKRTSAAWLFVLVAILAFAAAAGSMWLWRHKIHGARPAPSATASSATKP